MKKHVISTAGAPKAIGPYSQGIASDSVRLVFTAGQIGLDPSTGELVAGGIREQTERALLNIKAVVEAAGSRLDNVLKVTVYLRQLNDFSAFNDVYARFFATDPPARATVGVSALPKNALVELDAISLV
jgi:2-iminobutanoate/2-iminopropanoate deaminase